MQLFIVLLYNLFHFCNVGSDVSLISDFRILSLFFHQSVRLMFCQFGNLSKKQTFGFVEFFCYLLSFPFLNIHSLLFSFLCFFSVCSFLNIALQWDIRLLDFFFNIGFTGINYPIQNALTTSRMFAFLF